MSSSSEYTYLTTPSHKIIFDFWKDKCISKTGEIHFEGSYGYNESIVVITDWEEPSCWGCSSPIEKVYLNQDYDTDLNNDVSKIWNYKEVKQKLERCHIQPKALTNNNQPDNLFLLCRNCHRESPDYVSPIYFLEYIYRRRREYTYGIPLNYHIQKTLELCLKFEKDISTFDVEKLRENISLHANTHGFAMVDSTRIAAITDSMNSFLPDSSSKKEEMTEILKKMIFQIRNYREGY